MLTRAQAAHAALSRGMTQIGVPYVFGGDTPGVALDCDALYRFAWNGAPLLEGSQMLVGNTYTNFNQYKFDQRTGHRADPCEPADGLFITGGDPGPGGAPGHVMLFHSPGMVLQAEMTGTVVGLFPFDTENGWEYRCRPALRWPIAEPCPRPTEADLDKTSLVLLADPAQAREAIHNGWPLWTWDAAACWFKPANHREPPLTPEYANKNWRTPRP